MDSTKKKLPQGIDKKPNESLLDSVAENASQSDTARPSKARANAKVRDFLFNYGIHTAEEMKRWVKPDPFWAKRIEQLRRDAPSASTFDAAKFVETLLGDGRSPTGRDTQEDPFRQGVFGALKNQSFDRLSELRDYQQRAVQDLLARDQPAHLFIPSKDSRLAENVCELSQLKAREVSEKDFSFDYMPNDLYDLDAQLGSPAPQNTFRIKPRVMEDLPIPIEDAWEYENPDKVIGHPKKHRPSKKLARQQKKSKRQNRRK